MNKKTSENRVAPKVKWGYMITAITIAITGLIFTAHIPGEILGLLSSKNKDAGNIETNVLAARTRSSDFIYNVNIPSFFRDSVTLNDTLTVTGLSTLSGGLNTTTLTFIGTGTMNNLLGIDETTETTLEGTLDINGDVQGTGLNNVVIADGIIDETKFADTIEYDGDFDFTGTLSIGGTQVNSTAEELNYLNEATVSSGVRIWMQAII